MELWSDTGLHPVIKDLVEVANTLIAMAAVIVGGLFAYFKFLRQRVFHARLESAVAVSRYQQPNGREFLNIVARIKNTGLAKVDLQIDRSALRVFTAIPPSPTAVDEVTWKRLVTLDVPNRHQWIEAQEHIELGWLVALPVESKEAAYRSELRLVGASSEWYADEIVPPATSSDKTRGKDDE